MQKKWKVPSGYLFAVPVVLIILILYSGILRFFVPAVTIHGSTCQVVDFDYYYFSVYHEQTDDPVWLLQSGFDPEQDASAQMYSESLTWKDHFIALAVHRLASVSYYADLAESAGYVCPDLDEIVQQRQAEIHAFCTLNSIKPSNYYKAYYGSSMSEKRYFRHYQREVYAMQYKEYLLQSRPISATEAEEYCVQHNLLPYQTANLSILSLPAVPDRFTGEIGDTQLKQLEQKLSQLEQYYLDNDKSLSMLYDKFEETELGAESGSYQNLTHYELPNALSDWLYGTHAVSGDYIAVLDKESHTAYLAVLDGWGIDGAELEAQQALRHEKTESEEQLALSSEYKAELHELGLRLVAT